jgi:hypothetical protein
MKKLAVAVLCMAAAVLIGCEGGGGDGGGGSPAAGLNVTGFWENPLNGATAAGDLSQSGGSVTGDLLLPPSGMGHLTGTIDGYHMNFTIAWSSGSSESGSGDFAVVDTSTDKLTFTGNLPSVGDFVISWRGPSFDQHDPAEQTLTYTPSAPTW